MKQGVIVVEDDGDDIDHNPDRALPSAPDTNGRRTRPARGLIAPFHDRCLRALSVVYFSWVNKMKK